MKKLLFLPLLFITVTSFSQGYIFMKDGDTLQYVSKEYKSPFYKVTLEGQSKPIKIHSSNIADFADYPEYKLRINEVDQFTGSTKQLTNYVRAGYSKLDAFGSKNFLIFWFGMVKSEDKTDYVIIMRTPASLGCCGADGNYAIIKLKNGETINLEKDIAKIDCKRNAESMYIIDETTLNILKEQPLDAIRFKQSEGYMDFTAMFPDCFIESLKLFQL